MMEVSFTINGEKLVYNLIADYTYPCPVCGVHGCSGEYYFVTADKKAVRVDKSDLDMLMYDYLSENIFNNYNEDEYNSLPRFLKEYNEAVGWNDSDDMLLILSMP